ncbi:MAG: hypothetical protein ACRECT_05585 [Thermoplasmata archaeon]
MTTTTTTTYAAPTPSRPLGVAILAVLIGIYGFVLFLLGLLVAVASSVVGSLGGADPLHGLGITDLTVAGIILLIVGLIILGLAVGLWHLRMWALVLTILFLVFEMVVYGLAGQFVTIGFILSLVLFLYLLAVSRHFF